MNVGSPYAVYTYSMNPDLGTDADLLEFKKRLNSIGLKLMLDFVPNHSAVDCMFKCTTILIFSYLVKQFSALD